MLLDEPRPLIVMTGKSLLRHPLAAAEVSDLARGRFEPVLRYEKPGQKAAAVKRLVLCSGKVFVDVVTSPAYEKARNVSLVRFEELFPFPRDTFAREVARLKNVEEVIWLQEEPQNRGAWTFIQPQLRRVIGPEVEINYVGPPATPSPAEGANWLHKLQQNALIEKALGVS
jgi:2-oxoglutarate dehydrogenase E1 component